MLEPNCRGVRTLYRPDGATDYKGWLGEREEDDIEDRLGKPAWLNIDNRLGIVFSGTGRRGLFESALLYKPYRAIADDLTLSRVTEEKSLHAGEEAGSLKALLIPEQAHEDTPASRLDVLAGPDQSACLVTDGHLAAANFAERRRVCTFTQARQEDVPVYSGATVDVNGDTVHYHVPLNSESACLLAETHSLRANGEFRADAAPGGGTFVTNTDRGELVVEIANGEGAGEARTIGPGQILRIA